MLLTHHVFPFVTAQKAGKFADEIVPIKVKGKKGN